MKKQLNLTPAIHSEFQEIVDQAATLLAVPAGLIMRVVDSEIEVAFSSHTEGNPYSPGDKEHLIGSGLYCEHVISNRDMLLVPNALASESWKDNPDIKLNMISYLGYPIRLPSGEVFGTICVLDRKANAYDDTKIKLIERLRGLAERHLESVYMNQVPGDQNRQLTEYIDEIKTLRQLIPICAHCKSLRNSKGEWETIEDVLTTESVDLTHGICPACLKLHYPDFG